MPLIIRNRWTFRPSLTTCCSGIPHRTLCGSRYLHCRTRARTRHRTATYRRLLSTFDSAEQTMPAHDIDHGAVFRRLPLSFAPFLAFAFGSSSRLDVECFHSTRSTCALLRNSFIFDRFGRKRFTLPNSLKSRNWPTPFRHLCLWHCQCTSTDWQAICCQPITTRRKISCQS